MCQIHFATFLMDHLLLRVTCPICDQFEYGSFMNKDLFPELSDLWHFLFNYTRLLSLLATKFC